MVDPVEELFQVDVHHDAVTGRDQRLRPSPPPDVAITCSLARPGRPLYPVLVHRAAALLHASFRPRLATTPLRFANPSPPSGWIEDFHLQAVDHARHTKKGAAAPRDSSPSLTVQRAGPVDNSSPGAVFSSDRIILPPDMACSMLRARLIGWSPFRPIGRPEAEGFVSNRGR